MPPRAEKPREGVPLSRLKQRAYGRVHSQIRAGLMTVAAACEKCGGDPGFGRDGRRLLQAHHHRGYDFPTDVEWLCVQCHRDETPCNPRRGEASVSSKLTERQVRDIRNSGLNNFALARIYGVHRTNIAQIKHRKTWAHVD